MEGDGKRKACLFIYLFVYLVIKLCACLCMRKTQNSKNRASSNNPLKSSYSFEFPEVFYTSSIFIVFAPCVLLVCLALRLRVISAAS